MSLTLVTAAPAYPVTRAEAKAHLRLDTTDDDSLVDGLIAAAVAHVDGRDGLLGRALIEQTWDLKLDRFPGTIQVPLPPLQAVTSITYLDSANVLQTLSTALYQVDLGGGWPGRIKPAYGESWPATYDVWNAVTVRFRAGYTAGSGSPTDYGANVPQPIKHALLLLIGHWYRHRETVVVDQAVQAVEVPVSVNALLAPYKVHRFP